MSGAVARRATSLTGHALYGAVVLCVVAFMLLPTLVVIGASFSGSEYIEWPPSSFGLRQYDSLLHSADLIDATWRSLLVAAGTAAITLAVATPLVLGLSRARVPGGRGLRIAIILPMVTPGVAYAVALYGMFASLVLIDSFPAVLLAHVALCLPMVLLALEPVMDAVPREYELAAMSLGASRTRAWVGVTLRLTAPGLVAAGVLAFVTSFDEATLASFLTGPRTATLPKIILDSVTTGVDPAITAVSALLIVATALLTSVAGMATRLRRARRNRNERKTSAHDQA
ncbi:ABC transporter permease [Actinomadura madurae]|nr:ABC transporter permease [Actinomadura madurae]MCP9967668.1 ABC transporter permease [Actinomadura madurae]